MELHEVVRKVPGGKLLRVRGAVGNGAIRELRITGDFFLFPEESIHMLEMSLLGKELDRDGLAAIYDQVMEGCKVIGFSRNDLIDALMSLSE